MTYSEKLRSPLWQKRRLKVMEYAHWRCQICGAKDNTLHCHHSYYTKGKEPWQYPDGSIICICEKCHEKIHPEKVRREAPAAPGEKAQTFAEIMRARKLAENPTLAQPVLESDAKARFARMRQMLKEVAE